MVKRKKEKVRVLVVEVVVKERAKVAERQRNPHRVRVKRMGRNQKDKVVVNKVEKKVVGNYPVVPIVRMHQVVLVVVVQNKRMPK